MVSVGQKLWRVGRGWRNSDPVHEHEVTVTKVGRKWFYVDNEHEPHHNRYSIETLAEDGGQYGSRASCYESKEAYRKSRATNLVWDKFTSELRNIYRIPNGVDLADLCKVCELLKIDHGVDLEEFYPKAIIPESVFADGGLKQGELRIFLAGTGKGKSRYDTEAGNVSQNAL